MSIRAAAREVAAVLLWTAAAVSFTGLWSDLGRRVFGGADPIIDIWTLHHAATHLLVRPAGLFAGNIFFPAENPVLFSDPLLGPALLVQPVLLFSRNPVLLYNVALLLCTVAASHGLWRLSRHLGCDPVSAALPALVVPFMAHQVHHLVHLNLFAIAGFPWMLLGLLRLLEAPTRGAVALTVGAFVWQAATSGYHAVASAVLCLVVAAWGWRALTRPRTLAAAAGAALCAAVLLLPYLLSFLRLQERADLDRAFIDNVAFSLSLPDGLVRTTSWLWSRLIPLRGDSAFPGLVVGALCAIGAVRLRDDRRRWLFVGMAVVFLALSLGPILVLSGRPTTVTLPYAVLLDLVPPLRAGRHPVTFVVGVLLATGLLAAMALARLRVPASARAALVALAVLETWAPPPGRRELPPTPEAYRAAREDGAVAIAELPFDDELPHFWATTHGLPTTAGVSPFVPRLQLDLAQRIRNEWRRERPQGLAGTPSLAMFLRFLPVSHLVVHPGLPGQVVENLERTPEIFPLVKTFEDGRRLYRVRRVSSAPRVRRMFRQDQLHGRRVVGHVRAPETTTVVIELNQHEIARRSPGAFDVPPPRPLLRKGLNEVVIRTTDGTTLDLHEIDTRPDARPDARPPRGTFASLGVRLFRRGN